MGKLKVWVDEPAAASGLACVTAALSASPVRPVSMPQAQHAKHETDCQDPGV